MSGPCLSSSVAGRPLRPATRRSLGEPLPHQLADRPRAHPEAPGYPGFSVPKNPPVATFGINPPFGGLFPTSGQVAHVLLTLAPLSTPVLLQKYSVRLACLIHAASVRSEPESNSPSKFCAAFRLQYRICEVSSAMKFACSLL